MKVGDLVRVREVCFNVGFHDEIFNATMLVTAIETTLPGTDIEIAPVVQVLSRRGLSRLNIDDLEVVVT